MEEMATAGMDTSFLDDEVFNVEAAQERYILRLIASCCNGEFLSLMMHHKRMPFSTYLFILYNLNSRK